MRTKIKKMKSFRKFAILAICMVAFSSFGGQLIDRLKIQDSLELPDGFTIVGGQVVDPDGSIINNGVVKTVEVVNVSSSWDEASGALYLNTNDVQSAGTTNAFGINLDTSNFDGNLGGSDSDVQTAMETIDDLALGGGGTVTTILLQDGDWPHDGSPSRAPDLINGLPTFGYSFDDSSSPEATFPAFCTLASTNQNVWTHSGYIYSAETNGMTNVTWGLKIQSGGTTYWSTNTQTVVGTSPDSPESFSYTFTQDVSDVVCHISLWGGGYATNNGDFVTIANKVMVQE